MRPKIDLAAVTDFAFCLGHMISMERPAHVRSNPRPAMFTYAVAGDEGSFEQSTRNLKMDMVVMAFEPGREREGPTNIAVYEERAGEIICWPNCSPWNCRPDGVNLLLVDGRDFGFGYDGRSLVMHWDVPTDQLEERVARGKGMLRLMTQCIPPHLRVNHRLDPPIRSMDRVRRSRR